MNLEPRQEFQTHGVTIVKQVLTDKDLAPVIEDIETWISRRALVLKERGLITELYENEPFETRYARLFAQSIKMSKGLDIMYLLGPGLFKFFHNPRLLDLVETIIGPEITCNPIQHIRAKPPSVLEGSDAPSFHNVPWHQDAGVMMAEAEASNIVTCWLPLVDVTEQMGPMRAIPGCVDKGYLKHISEGETMIDPALIPAAEPIGLTCQKGDVILMNRFTPHCSTPNKSDQCRWSLDLRYQTTGHHTGRTAHPEFVVRSQSKPVDDSFERWRKRWLDAFENPHGFAGHRIHQV